MLKQHEAGRKVPELAREIGVSEATIYTWKSKYGGMDVNEAQRLKGLEDENRRLKTPGGRSQPGQRSPESGDPKKRVELAGVRTDVAFACEQFEVSERRACKLYRTGSQQLSLRTETGSQRGAATRAGDTGAAETAVRIPATARAAGESADFRRARMRVYRLYRAEGLMVRRLKRKRLSRVAVAQPYTGAIESGMGAGFRSRIPWRQVEAFVF